MSVVYCNIDKQFECDGCGEFENIKADDYPCGWYRGTFQFTHKSRSVDLCKKCIDIFWRKERAIPRLFRKAFNRD